MTRRRTPFAPAALFAPALVAWVAACGGGSESAQPSQTEGAEAPASALPDVLLITLDTTRADRIGAYGYDKALTDSVDALAARGRRYERAYSPMPLTIPSHSSIFTGTYPPTHGVRNNGDAVLKPEAVTLAERLAEAGYHTGASVGAFVTTRTWGFDQGFESYSDEVETDRDFWHSERPGAEVVDDLLAWRASLPADGRPAFGWAHLYDAHFPYVPREPWKDLAEGRPYDGEIAYLDDQVGRLLEGFSARPTLVVLVGDHGEGLGQHNELTHGLFVYDSTQRVPFVIAGPGVAAEVVTEPVSLVDVTPTILSLLGLPPLANAEGRAVPGTPPAPVYVEAWMLAERFGISAHRAVISGDRKYIDVPRPELYDATGADPLEMDNLAEKEPARAAELKAALDAFGFGPPSTDPSAGVAPGATAQLQALGYVDPTFTGDLAGPLPDPKDNVQLVIQVQQAEKLQVEGKFDELFPIAEGLATLHPEVMEFQTRFAMLLERRGQRERALTVLEAALQRDPANALLKQSKGTLLARLGRAEEASILFQEVAEVMPFTPRIRAMAVAALLETPGGANKGLELGFAYLEDHPDDTALAGLLGVELVRRGRFPRGLVLLEKGASAGRPERDVASFLASARIGQARLDEARQLFALELKNYPNNAEALIGLLRVHGQQGNWAGQVEVAERFLKAMDESKKAPQGGLPPQRGPSPELVAEVWHYDAQALYNLQRYAEARVALDAGKALNPDWSKLLVLEANLLKQEGHPEEAKQAFEKAKASHAREEAAAAVRKQAAPGATPSGAAALEAPGGPAAPPSGPGGPVGSPSAP